MIRLPRGGLAVGYVNDLHTEELAAGLQRTYLGTIRRAAKIHATRNAADPWDAAAEAFRAAVMAERADAWADAGEAIRLGLREGLA